MIDTGQNIRIDGMDQHINFDLIAKYYDLLYANRDDDLDMWLNLTAEITGSLLELGCGTGRITIPLLQNGKRVTGVDISEVALNQLKVKIIAGGFRARAALHNGDMRHLNLPQKEFAFAFIPINTFMHCLTIDDQQATLQAVNEHLEPGGKIVIDVYHPHPEALMEADGRMALVDQVVDDATGHTIQWYVVRRLHLDDQIQEVSFILDEISPKGVVSRQTFTFPMRYIHRYELELLLRSTDFALLETYGDYDQSPFQSESPRLICIAQKL